MMKNNKSTQKDYYQKNGLVEDDYNVYDYPNEKDNQVFSFVFSQKKSVAIALTAVVLVIIVVLALSLLSQKNNPIFFNQDGDELKSKITRIKNGDIIDSYDTNGKNLILKGNLEAISTKIKSSSTKPIGKNISGTIKLGGKIIRLDSNSIYFDEKGDIQLAINPLTDLELEDLIDPQTGELSTQFQTIEATFEFAIIDQETGEEIKISLPTEIIFDEFSDEGSCIALSRVLVKNVTRNGRLLVPQKIRSNCPGSEIVGSVSWSGKRMGNVEIVFGNFSPSIVLSSEETTLIKNSLEKDYDIKIIFSPFKEFAGQKASFKVNFGTSSETISTEFNVAIDNLEQCIKIYPEKLSIPQNQNSASLSFDVSNCHSDSIEISLCDNDPNCAGGSEGGISLEQNKFTLNPKTNPKKNINITRQEIPGAYGISISTTVKGYPKEVVDEKLLIIEPNADELLVPDKFVISLLGNSRDSMKIKNKSLAEDVKVEASICSVYNNSLGIIGSRENYGLERENPFNKNSWWREIVSNPKYYSGEGKYQASLINAFEKAEHYKNYIQLVSSEKNSFIKKAYTDGVAMEPLIDSLNKEGEKSVDQAKKLKDKVAAANEFAEANLASQVVSMTTSLASLSATAMTLTTKINSDNAAINAAMAASGGCAPAIAQVTAAQAEMTAAATESSSIVAEITEGVMIVNSLYGLYQQISSFTSDTEKIDAENALRNSIEVRDNLIKVTEKTKKGITYLNLALDSASIDSFDTASIGDKKAEEYLELAKIEFEDINALLNESIAIQINANNAITLKISELPGNDQLIIEGAQMLLSLINMIGLVETKSALIQGHIAAAISNLTAAQAAATAAAATCPENPTGCACEPAVPAITSALSSVSSSKVAIAAKITAVAKYVSLANTTYTAFSMYQAMTNDYTEEFSNTQNEFTKITEELYTSNEATNVELSALPNAIYSAKWLSDKEKEASISAGYVDAADLEGDFDKKRLNGLLGVLIINGFVNGAYDAGIYTTKNYANFSKPNEYNNKNKNIQSEKNNTALFEEALLKEDCGNIISLTIPDYSINLINDANPPKISNPNILASWEFSNSKVFGVFEKQEAPIIFLNNGLNKNSYATLTLSAKKHIHGETIRNPSKFGPFNIPDSSIEEVSFKYHIKLNVEQRKGINFVSPSPNTCENELVIGRTGPSALPKTILSWDWNNVYFSVNPSKVTVPGLSNSPVTLNEPQATPFIDATQLSILLSKKLSALNSLLEEAILSCPMDPSQEVLNKISPSILQTDSSINYSPPNQSEKQCYLPFSTRTFDNKPALYYYFENTILGEEKNESDYNNYLIDLVDFNVNLIRDGYGWDFQYDFVNSYSSRAFLSDNSFINPNNGIKKFFSENEYAFFSSQANYYKPQREWIIPDSGKYNVKVLIEFLNSKSLFRARTPSARIIFDIYLIEPINSNYSPFYYLPFDGFVGLNSVNNRRSYGTSFSRANQKYEVSPSGGIEINGEQKDSLVKINGFEVKDVFVLNSSPYLNGVLLDVKYVLNANNGLGSNSMFLFAKTIATPLIFEVFGENEKQTELSYSIKINEHEINYKGNSLFLLSGFGECTDLAGTKLNDVYFKRPDKLALGNYNFVFPLSVSSGKTFLKTIAFTPIDSIYSLSVLNNNKVYSTNNSGSSESKIVLEGISGTSFNDKKSNSVIHSLQDLYKAIENGEVCVTNLGQEDIYWWPSNKIFEEKGSNQESLKNKEEQFTKICN